MDADAFFETVEARLKGDNAHGALAYVEIFGRDEESSEDRTIDPLMLGTNYKEIFDIIRSSLGARDIFCYYGGRFVILTDRTMPVRRTLREISREIAGHAWNANGSIVHLTPIIGYVDIAKASDPRQLWMMAGKAIQRASESLELEPYHYDIRRDNLTPIPALGEPAQNRSMMPKWVLLSFQLIVSLLLGFGAPFMLYAACDALGFDISGPVYVGVVVVLVLTATSIWVEGLLAIKATTPPQKPGSSYPVATIIIPAFLPNEADTIIETLDAFLKIKYANLVQIILAYNRPGLELPIERRLREISAEQSEGGRFLVELVHVERSTSKAQNVNAVVGRVRGRFVGIFDADHHPHVDSLERAWRWLSNGWDIVQGRCSIRNGSDSWVARMVAVEFEQIYAVSHPGRARFHGFGIFGGSNGFWRTAVLHETRMRHSMLTEDIDSSIRAIVAGYRIAGDRDLTSQELAPTSIKQLLNQRLRWAQGWFQVSLRRVVPALLSRQVSIRQKLGLIHLLIWRELFPWYSIQVVPILTYWVWIYGWRYIHWTVPIFLLTSVYTLSTGPGQILIAYCLADKAMRRRRGWFVEYLFVSTLFFSPLKDMISRVSHIKEAMREKAWKVTPRGSATNHVLGTVSALLFLILVLPNGRADAMMAKSSELQPASLFTSLLGGEASTLKKARDAARAGNNMVAASLFEKAIRDVPRRRLELLPEYADALMYSRRSAEAVPLYRELQSSTTNADRFQHFGSQLALALTWSEQYGGALAIYNNLLVRFPGNADLAVHRARVLASLNRPDDALAAIGGAQASRVFSRQSRELAGEVLVDCARSKAGAGKHREAAALLNRAMQYDPRLRGSLTLEYGNEITASNRPERPNRSQEADPIADLKLVLERLPPGSNAFNHAQRNLAAALDSGGSTEKALDAWRVYLTYVPNDAEGHVRQAELLSQLNEPMKAREAFRAAYAIDSHNQVARAGIVNETIGLARRAARENRNVDAVALFEQAMLTDPSCRSTVLREYADQLSFNGHAGDAVPLYHEVIGSDAVSTDDGKRAMVGLANAYAWSQDLAGSLKEYTDLAAKFPDDNSLQWSKLVTGARLAAKYNRNLEAADLFEKAMVLDPQRGSSLSREYADQLTFTDRASRAIPIYKAVLAQADLQENDRLAASLGLAQAYERSGMFIPAEDVYKGLLDKTPSATSIQRMLLIVLAHDAAHNDRNRESAGFLARAIRLDPANSDGIIREYADQLAFSGRAKEAIPFYLMVSRQTNAAPGDVAVIKQDLAQAYDWAGFYDEAKVAYAALSSAEPSDALLRWHFLVVSARQAASTDKNAEAAKLFAQALQLLPARRALILKEYADKLSYSGSPSAAIPLYRELLTDKYDKVGRRDAALALAGALASEHHLEESLGEYQRLMAVDPMDVDAALGAAEVLSWGGHQLNAEAAYQTILSRHPLNGKAERGLAQAEDWEGHHRVAQTILLQRLQEEPADLAARRLLAQSLVWSGKPDKALDELHLALQHIGVRGDMPDRVQRVPAPATPLEGEAASAFSGVPQSRDVLVDNK